MISIADTCDLVARLYQTAEGWDHIWPDDGHYAAMQRVGNTDVVIWRGSTTILDWMDDFEDVPIEVPKLGRVERGFWVGVDAIADLIDSTLGPDVVCAGHSLGAARALLHAARRLSKGLPVSCVTVFGSPKPGFQGVADVLAPLTIWSYKNGDDPVTDVPGLILPYVHPRQAFLIDEPPEPGDEWGLRARHHIELYQAGVRKLGV